MTKNSKSLVSNDLIKKIISASSNKHISVLEDSKILNNKDFITTSIPAINLALSGRLDGGFKPGLMMIAGPSKHFKTLFMLFLMKEYLDKYPQAVAVLYDAEFGAALEYFASLDIDPKRVVHSPITDVEQLKSEIMNLLTSIERGEKVFIALDSVGNLASAKEVQDALDSKQVADMTRAKALKSLGRMITPHLNIKDIPMVVVNHTYQTMEMFSKAVVGGGTGLMYSSDDVWIIGRQQEKETSGEKKLIGWNFIINIEKSRSVNEKSKIPVTVIKGAGIYKYSAILDLALDSGHITKPANKTYELTSDGTIVKEKDIDVILKRLMTDVSFNEYVETKYKLSSSKLVNSDDEENEILEDE